MHSTLALPTSFDLFWSHVFWGDLSLKYYKAGFPDSPSSKLLHSIPIVLSVFDSLSPEAIRCVVVRLVWRRFLRRPSCPTRRPPSAVAAFFATSVNKHQPNGMSGKICCMAWLRYLHHLLTTGHLKRSHVPPHAPGGYQRPPSPTRQGDGCPWPVASCMPVPRDPSEWRGALCSVPPRPILVLHRLCSRRCVYLSDLIF